MDTVKLQRLQKKLELALVLDRFFVLPLKVSLPTALLLSQLSCMLYSENKSREKRKGSKALSSSSLVSFAFALSFPLPAVNIMAYGTKRWKVYPPSEAWYSKLASADYWLAQPPPLNREPLECTQHAGDIFYVPARWGHGTLNERQSIGVAYEFALEPFCME
jgi:hypothetical protein